MLDLNGRMWIQPILCAVQGSLERGGTPDHCEWMSSSLLDGGLRSATRPQKCKARCEAFFSCWSCHRKCSGAEECLGFLAPRSGEGQTAPGFSLAKCCSTSGCLSGDSAREWGCVYPILMQLFHAGQQLRAGRGAHSFPTRCVPLDLVKSTLSTAKLFGKKIKPDSLTN